MLRTSTRTLLYQPVQELRSLTDRSFYSYGPLTTSCSPCLASLCWSNEYFYMHTNHPLVCSSSNVHKHLLSWRRVSPHYRLLALTHDSFSASTPRPHNLPLSWISKRIIVPHYCQGCSYQAEEPEIHSVQATGRAALACLHLPTHPKSSRFFLRLVTSLQVKVAAIVGNRLSIAWLESRPQYWPWRKFQCIIALKALLGRY